MQIQTIQCFKITNCDVRKRKRKTQNKTIELYIKIIDEMKEKSMNLFKNL